MKFKLKILLKFNLNLGFCFMFLKNLFIYFSALACKFSLKFIKILQILPSFFKFLLSSAKTPRTAHHRH